MREELLSRLNRDWRVFLDSFDGLPDSALSAPGVVGEWSIRDIMGHVTTWEAEALNRLPLLLAHGDLPSYEKYGGGDAFNAQKAGEKRNLTLPRIRQDLEDTHQRLVARFIEIPDATAGVHFERHFGEDTWDHYRQHAGQIRAWRNGL